MSDLERRIKLAEAMGWGQVDMADIGPCWQSPDNRILPLPDPFASADDDYAVLEWAYGQGEVFALKFAKHLKNIWRYQIGDYARAALKVIE